MSNKAINAVLDHSKTKGSTRLLMLVIADGIGKDTNSYHASVKTLTREVNCTERYLQKLIHKCLQSGELLVLEDPGHASWYAIPIMEGEAGYSPESCDSENHICTGYHTPVDKSREEVRNAVANRRGARRRGAL